MTVCEQTFPLKTSCRFKDQKVRVIAVLFINPLTQVLAVGGSAKHTPNFLCLPYKSM